MPRSDVLQLPDLAESCMRAVAGRQRRQPQCDGEAKPTRRRNRQMKRSLKFLALLAALSAMPSCSWFSKHPVIPAVVTCSGETIPIALVTRTYDDAMTENWIDLAENVVPLLKDGYADLTCIWNYLGTSNPETLPHINAMKAKHAAEFKGSASCSGSPTVVVARMSSEAVACARRCGDDGWSLGSGGCACRTSEALRSPGDATPKPGPTDATPKPGPTAREDGAGSTPAGWPTTGSKTKGLDSPKLPRVGASLDSTKTRGVRPALPGADGTTEATASDGAREPAGTPVGPAATSLAVTALPSAGAETSSRPTPPMKPVQFSYPSENPGAALERCDRTCGEHLTSLATVKGCLCWRGKGRSGHWVALREAPGLGLVAAR
jgi:hypothetical protein